MMPLNQQVNRMPVSGTAEDAGQEGPNEATLVMYSLFMAVSSLIFGGLSLWHVSDDASASAGSSVLTFFFARTGRVLGYARWLVLFFTSSLLGVNPQTMVWLASMLCLVVLLAFATNPGDTSFRSYLTDLALHQHLHGLRQDALDASNRRPSSFSSAELQDLARNDSNRPAAHVHSFATRISVSLRTPAYNRTDYGLASVVIASEQDHHSIITKRRYVGAFGKWWMDGSVADAREEHVKETGIAGWGVSGMRAREPVSEDESATLVSGPRKQSEDQTGSAIPSEKSTGKRKKHGNKGRQLQAQHLPLLPAVSSKEASTSYDAKYGGEDSLTNGEYAIPSSPALNEDAGLPWSASPTTEDTPAHATATLTHSSDTAQLELISEAQAQLDQVRSTSETARKALRAQLEELRTRKRDEDAARLDLKSRVKLLDEHKRQAESVRREAERRLKAANGLKEGLENRIAAKTREIVDLRRKEMVHKGKAMESATNKVKTLADLQQRVEERRKEGAGIELGLKALNEKLDVLQHLLLEAECSLQAARDMASERYYHGDAAHHQSLQQHQQLQHQQPSHSLVGGDFYAQQHRHPYADPQETILPGVHPLGPTYYDANQNRFAGSNVMQPMHNTPWMPNGFPDVPLAPQARPLARVAAMLDEQGDPDGPDDAFDPTVILPVHQAGPVNRARFSPFSFDGASMMPADLNSISRSRLNSVTPVSPFSSDLLPSNLFLNADEDEQHAGILPGTRSERVEAALNRFGLDTSDTSDAEAVQDDAVDEERAEASEQDRSEPEKSAQSSNGRTWWGGRTRSKERMLLAPVTPLTDGSSLHNSSSNDACSEVARSVDDTGSMGKRRSLSIFPKLSLNPGAKSFRGPMRRNGSSQVAQVAEVPARMSVDEPYAHTRKDDDLIMRQAWNASSGHLPTTQHDYETLKRAFESDGARGEQLGSPAARWTASDREQTANGSSGGTSGMAWPSHLGASPLLDNVRASSDTLPFGVGRPPTSWLDDMIMPLERTTSRGSQKSTQSTANLRLVPPPSSKPSRFALWRNNTAVREAALGEQSADNSVSGKTVEVPDQSQDGETAGAEGGPANSAPPGEMSSSKSKRTSSLWSRKVDVASSSAIEGSASDDSLQL